MDLKQLVEQIKSRTGKDVAAELESYLQSTKAPNRDGFLHYLRDRAVIDGRTFGEMHTQEAVDLSATAIPATTALRPPVHLQDTIGDPGATRPSAESAAHKTDASSEAPLHHGGDADNAEVSRYEVLGELGKGAMGEVHLVRDLVLRRKVAMKSILPHMQESQAIFGRFLGEMQITAQLDHPFIVPVYGVDTGPSGGLAYAMKLVQGKEFGDLLNETRLLIAQSKPLDADHTLGARLEAFVKVCDAMAYAHERGVVHRDLKPANIMLGPFNEVYVMDWGIARLMGPAGAAMDQAKLDKVELLDAEGNDASQTARTRVGSTLGTPLYMSPEQAAGKNDELDGRSDLYTLGLILQEVVTLKGAVGGATLQEVLTNAKEGRRLAPEPPSPDQSVPRELAAILDKATRREAAQRYASVREFADDIRRFLRNEAVAAAPDTLLQGLGRWSSKHRMATIALLLLTFVAGIGATGGVLLYRRAEAAEQQNREYRLAELQASSGLRAQELDATLQGYESLFTKLAGAAAHSLGIKPEAETDIHFSESFKPGSGTLKDLIESPFHGGHVSFEYPVVALAPGVAKEAAAGDIGAIQNVKTLAKSLMLESFNPAFRTLSEAEQQRILTQAGTPITRIALTLESGVHAEYPGMAGLDPGFDGRTTDAYKRAKDQVGVSWGKPQPGRGGMVLPATTALHSHDGKFLGVLAFDVSIERAVASALEATPGPHVEASMLVEKDGKVLAQRGQENEPQVLGMQSVLEAIARGESGYLQTKRSGHDVLVTYTPLNTVDWYLVTVANLDAVKKGKPPANTRAGSATKTPAKSASPATPGPVVTPVPPPTAEPSASAEPEPEPSASASASAAPSAPALGAPWPSNMPVANPAPTAAPTAAPVAPPPSAPPPNPFDPWKAYDKDKKP